MDKDSLSHTIRYCACHVVWIPRRRRKAPCGETEREVGEMPGMLAGAGIGTVCLTVAVEKWLFRRGERRRAAGVRLAHTRQGLVIGALTGAASAVQFAVAAPAD